MMYESALPQLESRARAEGVSEPPAPGSHSQQQRIVINPQVLDLNTVTVFPKRKLDDAHTEQQIGCSLTLEWQRGRTFAGPSPNLASKRYAAH
eukprot:2164862-Rhodomonas_salina.2